MDSENDECSNEFDRLLSWLDPDRAVAAEKYLRIRLRLIEILARKGCWESEDVADETFDRVARKVESIRETYKGDPAAYFGGVARHVLQEWRRKKAVQPPSLPLEVQDPQAAAQYDCLDHCMQKLNPADRNLIREYYPSDKKNRIKSRKAIAKREGTEIEALRLKAHRIRKVLRACVLDCVDHGLAAPQLGLQEERREVGGSAMDCVDTHI